MAGNQARRVTTLAVSALVGALVAVAGPAPRAEADSVDDSFDATVSVENATFYPLVVDEYKDRTVVVIGNDGYDDPRARVYDAEGVLVSSLEFAAKDDTWRAAWDGTTSEDEPAPVGTYRVEVSGDLGSWVDGEWVVQTANATREVQVVTDTHDRRVVRDRPATRTSVRHAARGCRARSADTDLVLRCRSGRAVTAVWRFHVPATAKGLGHRVRHGGPLRVTAERTGRTTYVVTARVTRGHVARVEAVRVTYRVRTTR